MEVYHGIPDTGLIYLLDQPRSDGNFDPLSEKKNSEKLIEKEGYFNVGWNNQLQRELEVREIDHNKVADLKSIFSDELLLEADWDLCGHQPAYAVELYSEQLLFFRSSFCFDCDNWINECRGEFITLKMKHGKLFSWFQSIIPLPDNYGN